MAAAPPTRQLLSIYRRLLRELPIRQPAASTVASSKPLNRLTSPTMLQQRIRSTIASATQEGNLVTQVHQAEQFIKYTQAQRMYVSLVERYNPGMDMEEEERVRLTAKRVGMELPVLFEA